jgi:Luciferase-like monooxygenase
VKFGLYGLHKGENTAPEALARRARAAEDAGFESIRVGDHIALPLDAPDDEYDARLEALVTLAHLAAITRRVLLAVGVIVLPQRQPGTPRCCRRCGRGLSAPGRWRAARVSAGAWRSASSPARRLSSTSRRSCSSHAGVRHRARTQDRRHGRTLDRAGRCADQWAARGRARRTAGNPASTGGVASAKTTPGGSASCTSSCSNWSQVGRRRISPPPRPASSWPQWAQGHRRQDPSRTAFAN